jgi:hypothetical protein
MGIKGLEKYAVTGRSGKSSSKSPHFSARRGDRTLIVIPYGLSSISSINGEANGRGLVLDGWRKGNVTFPNFAVAVKTG